MNLDDLKELKRVISEPYDLLEDDVWRLEKLTDAIQKILDYLIEKEKE